MPTLRVVTLNCRNTMDRWTMRRDLLVREFVALHPDVAGLQELRRFPSQGKWIRDAWRRTMTDSTISLHAAPKQRHRWWREQIGILTRWPVREHERFRLPHRERVALRARVEIEGSPFDFYCTHLHHRGHESSIRQEQVAALLGWIARRSANLPHILVGDLNAHPDSAEIVSLKTALQSAYVLAHGREPARTFPAPASLAWPGEDHVLDYILVSPGITVNSCDVAFDATAEEDDRLSPSDHYGLVADITFDEPPAGIGERFL